MLFRAYQNRERLLNPGLDIKSVGDLAMGERAFIFKEDICEGSLGDRFVEAATLLCDGGGYDRCEVSRVGESLLHVKLNLLREFHLPIR